MTSRGCSTGNTIGCLAWCIILNARRTASWPTIASNLPDLHTDQRAFMVKYGDTVRQGVRAGISQIGRPIPTITMNCRRMLYEGIAIPG